MIINVRLEVGAQIQRKSRVAHPKRPVRGLKYEWDQLVRLETRDRRINEFRSRYQPNLHSPQGQKNNDAARTLTLRQRACLPSGRAI
jgi:hypothetical protein